MCARRKTGEKKKTLFSEDFYSDMSAPEMLHAVLIRSPFAYGRICEIGFAPKTKVPEGYVLFTHKELPEKKSVCLLGTEIPLLCAGEIAYKGEPVAILAGEDEKILEKLKSKVRIVLDKRELKEDESKFTKAYNSLSVSLKDGSPIEQSVTSLRKTLEDFSKPREIIAKRKIQVGNPEEIFQDEEKSAFIVEGTWKNHLQYNSEKETEGAFVQIKAGNLHIFTPSLWISELKKIVSRITGFDPEKIIVTRTRVTGANTNSLIFNGILSSLASIVAIKTGKPVQISLSREEQKSFIENPCDIKISHKTALDQTGIITAMEISIDYESGTHNPFRNLILDRLALSATGIYNCKNVKVNAKAYKSHNPPATLPIFRAESASFFAVENQIQKIARMTGFSPVDLRQMNKAGGAQKNTSPFTFSFGRANDVINATAIRSDFKRKYTVARLSEHERHEFSRNSSYAPPLRGIGFASAFEGSGYLGSEFEKSPASLTVSATEEKRIVVHALPITSTIRENWVKIIADSIEIDKRSISFTSEEDESSSKKTKSLESPEFLIARSSIKTILLKKCMDSIKRKKIDGTPFSVKKSIPTSRKKAWNQEEFSGSPYYNTAFGSCTLEVELDECTFREKIKRICVVIDGGKILNPKAAEGSVRKSIEHCLSSMVTGEVLKAADVTVQFTQSEEEPKSIGNIIYSILPAAFTSALSQAVAGNIDFLPLQTDSLFKAIEKREEEKRTLTEDAR